MKEFSNILNKLQPSAKLHLDKSVYFTVNLVLVASLLDICIPTQFKLASHEQIFLNYT